MFYGRLPHIWVFLKHLTVFNVNDNFFSGDFSVPARVEINFGMNLFTGQEGAQRQSREFSSRQAPSSKRSFSHYKLINRVGLSEFLPPPPPNNKPKSKKINHLIITGRKDCEIIKDSWLSFNQELVSRIGQEIALHQNLTGSDENCCNWIGVKCGYLASLVHLVSLEWQDEPVARVLPTIGYDTLRLYGFKIIQTSDDGHCQFHAIAERMNTITTLVQEFGLFSVQSLRNAVYEQLKKKPELWPVFYDDHDRLMFRTFSDYLAGVQYSGQDTNLIVFGTHMTLTAILEVYPVTITVYNQDTTQPITEGVDTQIIKPNINIFLAGLHYSSLEPIKNKLKPE